MKQKIIGLLSLLVILSNCTSNKKVDTETVDNSKADSSKQTAQTAEVIKNQQQVDFIKLKSDLYQSKYVNAVNDAQRSGFQTENKKVTKDFFSKTDNKIINWVLKAEGITLSDKPSDKKLLLQGLTPEQVKQKDPAGRSIDFLFTAFFEEQQYTITITPASGTTIRSDNPLYEKLINTKADSYVFVSGIVQNSNDYTTQTENGITLSIKLTDISGVSVQDDEGN